MGHANKAVFGVTKGPQKAHYKRLKKDWLSMKRNTDTMTLFDWEKYSGNYFLSKKAKQSLSWSLKHLEQKSFPRDDYKPKMKRGYAQDSFHGRFYLSIEHGVILKGIHHGPKTV